MTSPLLLSRAALVVTLTACGLSLWLVYKLSSSLALASSKQLLADEAADPKQASATDLPAKHGDAAPATEDVSNCKACQELIKIYQKVGSDFAANGLDIATIKQIQPWFHGVHDDETPWPKKYEEFPEPLPRNSVRLLVVPLDGSPSVAAAAAAITRDVLAVLPQSAKSFVNARTNYHCTVFHSSHPHDTRPDPFRPGGGLPAVPAGGAAPPPGKRPGPTAATLAAERAAVEEVVSSTSAPRLVLDQVVMARSGTLLLTWTDPTGHMAQLRASLVAALPGASSKQASIIHSSLLRLLSDEQLGRDVIAAVDEVCARWTRKLRGRVLVPPVAWWIAEHEFSTINGDRELYRFQGA